MNYTGPGFFKPTKNKPKLRWYGERVKVTREPEVFEIAQESPDNLAYRSPAELVPAYSVDTVPLPTIDDLENYYFTSVKNKQKFTRLIPQQESTTTIAINYNGTNSSDMNPTSELEPIFVNVTKTNDKAPPLVLKTKMYQDQLMKWLSKLQHANKSFAVHITTN